MKTIRTFVVGLAVAVLVSVANAQSVVYPNGNPGDWTDNATGNPVSVNPVASGGPNGGAYTQIFNVDDEYQAPGYGAGPYSLFGAGITTSQPFYQSVDVYINAGWAAPTPSYAQSFWIDMTPNSSDNSTFYGAEHNFRLTASGSNMSVSVDGQASPISTIATSGWYDFQMAYSPDPIGTNPELTSMNIFSVDGSGNPSALVGTTNVVADSPGGPTESQNVTGSGYVWFTVWANGSAGDTLNVANVEAVAVPEPGTWALVAIGTGLGIFLRGRRQSRR
jgi:hypothetical protein